MPKDMADALRAAVLNSGYSANQIAKATGVPQTTLSRFLRGEDMSVHRAAKIAAYLGLELREKR
jgi:transcriptional regulator with XRE-family HTH domain